jgi:hypothetical protein
LANRTFYLRVASRILHSRGGLLTDRCLDVCEALKNDRQLLLHERQ